MDSTKKRDSTKHKVHLSIAETGKLYAVKGNHTEAMKHYREAMRLAVSSRAPEVFIRHYTQCVLESLELTAGYDEIITFCNDAHEHYSKLKLNSSLHRRDHGSILERLGMVQLKNKQTKAGQAALELAHKIAGDGNLPATEEVLGWIRSGFTVDVTRLLQCQHRHNYFIVRPQKIDANKTRMWKGEFKFTDQVAIF